jgi:hypothetical protein
MDIRSTNQAENSESLIDCALIELVRLLARQAAREAMCDGAVDVSMDSLQSDTDHE